MAKTYVSRRSSDTALSRSFGVKCYDQGTSPVIHSSLAMISIIIFYYSLY